MTACGAGVERTLTDGAPTAAPCHALDPDDFSFHGFGDRLPAVVGSVRRLQVRSGEPRVVTLDNAVFVPVTRGVVDGRPVLEGGIFDEAGRPVPTDGRRPPLQSAPLPERVIDEEIVYLGWLFGHYGHFMLESLSRSWVLSQLSPTARVVFHAATVPMRAGQQPRTVPWLWQLLEELGVPFERILILDRPARIRRLVMPEPLYDLSHFAHERAPAPFRAVASRILRDGSGGTASQPVYLSRRLLPSPQRQTIGEAELENLLQENGVLVAHPQTMAFEDQVRLFNRHADIIAADGAAVWGTLISLGSPRLHLLVSQDPYPDLFLVSKVIGATASFVRCLGSGGRPDPPGTGRLFPYLLDFDALLAYLDEVGILRRRQRAVLLGRAGRARELHAEAWLYMRVRQAASQSKKTALARQPGATLSPGEEQEAMCRSATSWPLSFALAWYHVVHDGDHADLSRISRLLRQCGELIAAESDLERLARYADDARKMAQDLEKRCRDDIARQGAMVVASAFAPVG